MKSDKKIIEICEVSDICKDIEDAKELVSKISDTQRHIHERLSCEIARQPNEEFSNDGSTIEKSPTVQVNHTTTENIEQSPAASQANQNTTALIPGTVQQPFIVSNNVVSIQPQSKLLKLVLPTFRGKIP